MQSVNLELLCHWTASVVAVPRVQDCHTKLKIAQIRKCGGKAKQIAIPGVDPRHQRLDQILVRFTSQPAADERAERFISVDGFGRLEEIQSHARFAEPGNKIGLENGLHIGGNHHGQTIGQRLKLVVMKDVGILLLWVGAMQTLAQT